MGISTWKGYLVNRILLLGGLLLIILPLCKAHLTDCMRSHDAFPIPHQFYQPGDVVIGEIVSQVWVFQDSPSFTEHPVQTLIDEPA